MTEQLFDIEAPFVPSQDRTSPLFWVEELRVYRDFSAESLQCSYPLRRGLNILWADPGEGGKELYQGGVRGHAAGKTTFCRLLRFILGEPVCGTSTFRNALAVQFPNVCAIAKVWLQEESWIVCRSIAVERRDIAFKGTRIEDVFRDGLPIQKYADFLSLLSIAVTKPLAVRRLPNGADLGWRQILPWLSRDQECRLSHLLEWRDTASESQPPEMSAADACYMVRVLMGLVPGAEEKLRDTHQSLLGRKKELEGSVPRNQSIAQYACRTVQEWGGEEDVSYLDEVALGAMGLQLEQQLKSWHQSDSVVQLHEKLREVQKEISVYQEKRTKANIRFQTEENALKLVRHECRSILADVKQEDAEAIDAANENAPLGRCNTLLFVAVSKKCPCMTPERLQDLELLKNLDRFPTEAEKYGELIRLQKVVVDRARAEESRIRDWLEVLHDEETRAQLSYDAAVKEDHEASWQVKIRIKQIEEATCVLEVFRKSVRELDSTIQKLTTSSEELERVRKQMDKELEHVRVRFDDIIKAVMGKANSTNFILHAQRIELKISQNGDRTSAATETVKILAFDLAAMLQSSEGLGQHPRFLIHDSPREADLSPDIYQRFFQYMGEVEKKFKGGEPNYQYIVTTTEPPPTVMQAEPFLVAKLDASVPSGRLLKIDL